MLYLQEEGRKCKMGETLDSTQGKEDASRHPPVWLVWVKTIQGENTIMSICSSSGIAEKYRKYLKGINDYQWEMYEEHKYALIWVEQTIMDHLISINY